MNLDEMLNIVEKNDPDDVNLYMVHNINSKKGRGYSVVNPTIGDNFKEQLQSIVKDELARYKDNPQVPYNPVGTLDNVVETNKVASFIGLMQDAYYQTLIGKHKGMDKRR